MERQSERLPEYADVMKEIPDLMTIRDRVLLHRKALGFVADRIEDMQASSNLSLIEQAMEITEEMLDYLLEVESLKISL